MQGKNSFYSKMNYLYHNNLKLEMCPWVGLGWVVWSLTSHLYALVGYSGDGDMIWWMMAR